MVVSSGGHSASGGDLVSQPLALVLTINHDRFFDATVDLLLGTIRGPHKLIEILNWELKSGLRLGEHQVSGDTNRSEKSVGIAVLAYLFVLRVCHHEIVPGKPWSIFQLQHALRLRVMTNQVEHKVKVKMGKTRKAA